MLRNPSESCDTDPSVHISKGTISPVHPGPGGPGLLVVKYCCYAICLFPNHMPRLCRYDYMKIRAESRGNGSICFQVVRILITSIVCAVHMSYSLVTRRLKSDDIRSY